MGLLVIAFLAVIIILIIQNNNLKQEIIRLKNQIQKNNTVTNKKDNSASEESKQNFVRHFCPNCGQKLKENAKFCKECGYDLINKKHFKDKIVIENKEVTPVVIKPKRNEKEIKNNFILITGAVLVILSAILFLATTWSTSTNYLKTLILFLMLIVFFITSKIAENILDLKDTGRVFFNIALSYMPIALFSVSLFGVLGEYLSIDGTGKYIYLSSASFITSIIYYIASFKRKNNFLNIGSYLFNTLTVILIALIFTSNFNIVMISLLVYTAFISYLLPKLLSLYSEKINKIFSTTLYVLLSIIMIAALFIESLNDSLTIVTLSLFIIYLLVSKIVVDITLNRKDIYNGIYPVVFEIIVFNLITLITTKFIVMEIGLLIGLLLLTLYQVIKDKKISTSIFIEILLFIPLLYMITLVAETKNEYIILAIVLLITTITYLFNEKLKKFITFLIPILINLLVVNIILRLEINTLFITLISIILFITGIVLENKSKDFSLPFKIINTIFVISSLLLNISVHFENSLFIAVLLLISITYILTGIFKDKNIYKVIGYLFLNLLSIRIFNKLESLQVLTIPLVTIVITILNILIKKSKVKEYLVFQYIISFLSIYIFEVTIHSLIINIILSILFYNFGVEKNNKLKYISILSFIPIIYLKENSILSDSDIMYIVSLAIIGILTFVAYKKKDLNDYSALSFIYIVFHIKEFYDDKYMCLLILIVSSLIHFLITKDKKKDLFKTLMYIFIYILVMIILNDADLIHIVALGSLFTTVLILLITRTVIAKYNKNYKVFEYIGLIINNLITIGLLDSESGAILLIGLFLIAIIFAYITKVGPLLLCSLISLLITVFKLTKDFWLNLSWWIYVLVVGTILIVFAISNEVKEKKGITRKDRLKNLKNKLNL